MTSRRSRSVKPSPLYIRAFSGLSRRPRLITVTSEDRAATLDLANQLAARGIRHERWTYRHLFSARRLPRASYILTDFDRLLPWHVELAGRLYCRLSESGLTVLNDPRRFVPRWALLRRLNRAGINSFNCWLPAEGDWPNRFPVFLRTIHSHRGVESNLLQGPAEAETALQEALNRGRILSDLVFVEYSAEPTRDSGKFRKHACYGVGGRMIRAMTVTDEAWVAKIGILGAASDAEYAADLAAHRADPHALVMRRAFELSGMDFGRIDYGLVRGRPQIYELNTNPWIRWNTTHPNADRRTAEGLVQNEFIDALCNLPVSERRGAVDVRDILPRGRKRGRTFGQP